MSCKYDVQEDTQVNIIIAPKTLKTMPAHFPSGSMADGSTFLLDLFAAYLDQADDVEVIIPRTELATERETLGKANILKQWEPKSMEHVRCDICLGKGCGSCSGNLYNLEVSVPVTDFAVAMRTLTKTKNAKIAGSQTWWVLCHSSRLQPSR